MSVVASASSEDFGLKLDLTVTHPSSPYALYSCLFQLYLFQFYLFVAVYKLVVALCVFRVCSLALSMPIMPFRVQCAMQSPK